MDNPLNFRWASPEFQNKFKFQRQPLFYLNLFSKIPRIFKIKNVRLACEIPRYINRYKFSRGERMKIPHFKMQMNEDLCSYLNKKAHRAARNLSWLRALRRWNKFLRWRSVGISIFHIARGTQSEDAKNLSPSGAITVPPHHETRSG